MYASRTDDASRSPVFAETAFLAAALFVSAVVFPWVAVGIAIVYLAEGGNALVVLVAGALIDALYGAPVARLAGFHLVYAVLFGALALTALFLRSRLLE